MAINKTNELPALMQFILWNEKTDKEGGKDLSCEALKPQ